MTDGPRTLVVPDLSLVVLIGVSGSGKSTFARRHFASTQVLSSDACRGLVADDENDQSATPEAFALLHHIAGIRLRAGRLTVVDATNVKAEDRASLVRLAREHDVLPVAIVLDVPEAECLARNAARPDRDLAPGVVRRQRADLRRGLRGLSREGFRKVHVLGPDDVERAVIGYEKQYNDRREDTGPFDVVGDVHGCRAELEELLGELGYELHRDERGRAVDAVHPAGRRAVFVGDLVDRGPDSPGVLRLVMGMVAAGHALCVPGNHENKLVRALRGRDVQVTHGLERTLTQLEEEHQDFRREVEEFCAGLVSHYVLDGGALVVAHAGLTERLQGRSSARVRSFALYGDTTGETDEFGLPVRYPWAQEYRGRAMVLYGHTPVPTPEWVNNTLCLDTGCVFGGRLTALRYPERELVGVPARQTYYDPARPFLPAEGTAPPAGARPDGVLDVDDVLGKRVVETRLAGRVTVREENAAAALEVMSRFAVAPEQLLYLPPTMSPSATSSRPGLLEHPTEAFAHYRGEGVAEVVCQEKHMGSRAVALVRRDGSGVLHTRTGRSFFGGDLTAAFTARLSAAAERSGLFDELGTDWLLLDAELLPWSAKAGDLVRSQYAAVGAAARAALPAAVAALEAAAGRGLEVGDLLDRQRRRAGDAAAFTEVYRRYCWPTDGLAGVSCAPFQLLATAGTTYADRPHAWHLSLADRLAGADPELVRATRSLAVDLGDPAGEAAATAWWEELTAAGGEGVVVKPAANLTRGRRGYAQPGLKVRGREYLRLVYGPDYTEPRHLDRLRERSLGRKRGLALREYALGQEGLERLARGEPLWRVHECVFAVLALESEPVDPRL
ncbi:polynucleotide kinase-phosphatase [Geodermatophilus poikilotrophus]|uniref:Polynucleotide 3'-phosphatase /polynucleotide 5'-hydroxyl-kinase /polynucleotide 2',3'-cyclic phosphate phosphodiesterase n=1 Tax=Geodermatophilus poikilotrophus TaxID=1333667 RepID=A0A1I0EWY3_9ACTN|nr:polynucleotide kinase-phosphatase [Geodermatophilus poikilotrophus]SET49427.1 polynucleotide 3'-phosphatase /polynucleotide 5'-hydroxyl-kinase /polynucleotide 2',3'-cyclic phosphate phosphodiesterase [Geodermatophilus poikilotrophus]